MDVTFETANGAPRESRTVAELQRLRREHDLGGLEWTGRVVVRSFVVPHSHPVLTMNTRSSGDSLLATYLHEQLHWWLAGHPGTEPAIEASSTSWPRVAMREEGGSRNELSTRLHLFVCLLEHRAMRGVVGGARADAELAVRVAGDGGPRYGWVYRQVAERAAEIEELCDAHDLWPARLRPGTS